ncbi:MAG: 50S ribosomal protein L29 [Candidatus Yanofskybacteria bacterium RIFCSPHIGHO2_01_FULL_45_42]|uniref:Large ribosomal subunit protein uL29 n=3 Tax=Candidatus Yanofskyibacteriota TaxID=1752733 RepID=A0A1F8H680_9BACT|nr:MAG: 50S ribosomal protein L29 [Candidatus Yanofskybacteria bacterium RIFCSPHIGHO2_01_FULL_45_42]OGN16340.1 MAG: 50S ribosomal protein L29 [Candidatus Yanofskybacteria bacterium RIFCSPHIGHO2_02_FULL_46_19]OGN27001.1 MAG: 50S ribosomal protein L29 [Candidatus Yanofskybacteria bacterium RIFCSPLOWO2_01_FULL_45_72]OGN32409.1 MAG: 50S ribosomal protein L29 [Candidatus Yanofskybacteria bacterium RIFCSPLOWO2_02_FULL_45_18]
MKKNELQNKGRNELLSLLDELRGKLLQLDFERTEKRIKDSSQVKKTKQEIARALTAIKSAK